MRRLIAAHPPTAGVLAVGIDMRKTFDLWLLSTVSRTAIAVFGIPVRPWKPYEFKKTFG